VVGINLAARSDRVSADRAGGRGGGVEGYWRGQTAGVITIDEAAVAGREGRQRCAVFFIGVVGRDRERSLQHVEGDVGAERQKSGRVRWSKGNGEGLTPARTQHRAGVRCISERSGHVGRIVS